jgi:hypothetical protein
VLAERERQNKDAARFRWLREHAYIELDCDSPRLPGFTNERFDAEVDARIDGTAPEPEPWVDGNGVIRTGVLPDGDDVPAAPAPQPVIGSTGADWRHIGYARYVVPDDGEAQLVCCGPDEPGAFRIFYKPKERTSGVPAASAPLDESAIRADERERCANVCDQVATRWGDALMCVDAIRKGD